jgi:hypothetical protein
MMSACAASCRALNRKHLSYSSHCAADRVRLGRDFVPHFGARRDREIAERAVARALRPLVIVVDLLLDAVLEQRVARRPRVAEPQQTEVVAPPLSSAKRTG